MPYIRLAPVIRVEYTAWQNIAELFFLIFLFVCWKCKPGCPLDATRTTTVVLTYYRTEIRLQNHNLNVKAIAQYKLYVSKSHGHCGTLPQRNSSWDSSERFVTRVPVSKQRGLHLNRQDLKEEDWFWWKLLLKCSFYILDCRYAKMICRLVEKSRISFTSVTDSSVCRLSGGLRGYYYWKCTCRSARQPKITLTALFCNLENHINFGWPSVTMYRNTVG